mgnify:CR=1 FL=1
MTKICSHFRQFYFLNTLSQSDSGDIVNVLWALLKANFNPNPAPLTQIHHKVISVPGRNICANIVLSVKFGDNKT